ARVERPRNIAPRPRQSRQHVGPRRRLAPRRHGERTTGAPRPMKLVVTVYEETCDAAIDAIHALRGEHDMIEVRAERFSHIDLAAIRAATPKPILLTYRNARNPNPQAALEAGIDLIDVEWGSKVEVPERTVLSHHDYDGMHDVELIFAQMRKQRCAYTKLAATPRTFAENERLLALLPGSIIGMGERGLYSRILAPFRGS